MWKVRKTKTKEYTHKVTDGKKLDVFCPSEEAAKNLCVVLNKKNTSPSRLDFQEELLRILLSMEKKRKSNE